jgi:formate hydrogenlyase subunit 3/multisubunit Na+/H+ antiporter MnhD subunit
MGLDIKLPIGAMFTLLGLLIGIYGIATASNEAMYEVSLGFNVNLWIGILMLVFGVLMLAFSKRIKKEDLDQEALKEDLDMDVES